MKLLLGLAVLVSAVLFAMRDDILLSPASAQSVPVSGGAIWTEDPAEPISAFDEGTAEGATMINDRDVSVAYVPAGCAVSGGGGSTYGVFEVQVVAATAAASGQACADYGDTVVVQGVAFVFGTSVPDVLDATRIPSGVDAVVFGFDGDDYITPFDGAARAYVVAGAGADTVNAPTVPGEGGQTVFGGEGDDAITGSDGDDNLIGGPGNDSIVSGEGRDEVYGGADADVLNACPSDLIFDTLSGNDGVDQFHVDTFLEILQDNLNDYENDERVFDCDGLALAP